MKVYVIIGMIEEVFQPSIGSNFKSYFHKEIIGIYHNESEVGRHKFEAKLFEDDGGQLIGKIGKEMPVCREDATLEDWLDEAMEMSDFYHNLVDFLKEVKYSRNKD